MAELLVETEAGPKSAQHVFSLEIIGVGTVSTPRTLALEKHDLSCPILALNGGGGGSSWQKIESK